VVNGTVKRQDVFTLHNDVFFAATNAVAPFRRKRPGGDEDRAGQRQRQRQPQTGAINNTHVVLYGNPRHSVVSQTHPVSVAVCPVW